MPFKDHPYEPLLSPNPLRRKQQLQHAFLRCMMIPICFGIFAITLFKSTNFFGGSPRSHGMDQSGYRAPPQPLVRIVIEPTSSSASIHSSGLNKIPLSGKIENTSIDQDTSGTSPVTADNQETKPPTVAPSKPRKCSNSYVPPDDLVEAPKSDLLPSPSVPISNEPDSDFDSDFWSNLNGTSSPSYVASPSNLPELGKQAVLFRTMIEKLKSLTRKEIKSRDKRLFLSVESTLFPWIQDNLIQLDSLALFKSFKDQGIVMTLTQKDVKFGLHLVKSLRDVLECTTPIEIFYNGNDSTTGLTPAAIALFADVSDVKFIDIRSILPTAEKFGITSSAALKPFSILFSSFREVVYMDPDSVFLQDPAILPLYDDYTANGVILFRDRTVAPEIPENGETDADGSVVPPPSEAWLYADRAIETKSDYLEAQGRLFSNVSKTEGTSGVIVWNKETRFTELLLVSLLNSLPYQTDLYAAFKDDRDSYWIALEMMASNYVWAPTAAGVIGYKLPGDHVCGHLFHPDLSLQPLWFSGTILTDRDSSSSKAKEPLETTNWIMDATLSDDWVKHEGIAPYCMKPTTGVLGMLTETETNILDRIKKAWKEIDEKVDIDEDGEIIKKSKTTTDSDSPSPTPESSESSDSSSESNSSENNEE